MNKLSIFKRVAALSTSTIISQAVGVVALPIIARLYGPSVLGNYGVFLSIVSLAALVSSFRYELAIPTARTEKEARDIFVLTISMTIYVGFLFGGVLLAIQSLFPSLLRFKPFEDITLLWFLVPVIILAGCYNSVMYYALSRKAIGRIATSKLIQVASQVAIQITLFRFGLNALLLSSLISILLATLNLGMSTRFLGRALNPLSDRNIQLIYKYRDFALFSAPSALAQALNSYLPTIIISSLSSATTTGYWVMTQKISSLPYTTISSSIQQALHKDLSDIRSREEHGKTLHQLIIKLMIIAIPPTVVTCYFTNQISQLILGSKWVSIGPFLQLLLPMCAIEFIFSPLQVSISTLGLQKIGLKFQVIKTSLAITTFSISLLYFDFYHALIMYAASGIACVFVYRSYILKILSVNVRALNSHLAIELTIWLIIGGLAYSYYQLINARHHSYGFETGLLLTLLLGLYVVRLWFGVSKFTPKSQGTK